MEDERPFIVRAYSKVELACLYNPTQCVTVALQTFARWVRANKQLWKELEAMGYNKYRRAYTPAEVRVIVRFLGEP